MDDLPAKKEMNYLCDKCTVMKTQDLKFNTIVETIYALPLEDRLEIKTLLEHNIADARRDEIAENFKKSQEEYKTRQLEFSSNIDELKQML